MRRIAALGVAALLALAAIPAGAGERFGATEPYPGIRALLDRRAEAMLAGDEGAFMATVDRANPAFVRRQSTLRR